MISLIELININKKYDKQIIFKDLSLKIYENEILVILGSSGVGKSTLLNILTKVDNTYEGEVIYKKSMYDNIKIPLPIVFQEFDQLFPWFTVKKNIMLPMNNFKELDKKILNERFESIVDSLELKNSLDKYPVQLSGGMKQRTAIARALMCDSKILFMDEPFGSLDIKLRRNLQNIIKNVNKKYNKTIVFITHDIEEAVYIGHRILVLKDDLRDYEIFDAKEENIIKKLKGIL